MLAFLRNQGGTRSAVFEPDGSWSSALGGAPFHLSYASVHHGAQHHVGEFFLSSQSNSGFRVDPETVSVSAASEKVAGVNRPVPNLTTSLLLTLFFSVPQSQYSWDRGSSPTMGWVAGVCFSSLCADSCSSVKAPLVLWGPADNHSSLLAPEALVSGVSGAGSRRAGGSASGQGSVEPSSCSSTVSGSVKASSSCLETIQRFIRSRGFSRHVAKQAALVRRPSSSAGYHAKWSIYRRWCTSEGHSIYRPSLSNFADFLFWLRTSDKLSVSAVLGYRSMISAVFRSVLPEISTSPVLHGLSCGSTC